MRSGGEISQHCLESTLIVLVFRYCKIAFIFILHALHAFKCLHVYMLVKPALVGQVSIEFCPYIKRSSPDLMESKRKMTFASFFRIVFAQTDASASRRVMVLLMIARLVRPSPCSIRFRDFEVIVCCPVDRLF